MWESIGYKDYEKEVGIEPEGYFCVRGYIELMNNSGMYCGEEEIINKIRENANGYFDFNKNIIDIGCEIGVYCFNLDFAHYYMFDGNKGKLIMAQMNMLIRDKEKKYDAYACLLSDKDERIKYDGFLTSYSNAPEYYHSEYEEEDRARTLDSFNIKNVGFIKIDVEGMEEKVIRGGIRTIEENNYPPILFELWDVGHWGMTQERHDSLVNLLESMGYEILWYWGDWETHLAIHK